MWATGRRAVGGSGAPWCGERVAVRAVHRVGAAAREDEGPTGELPHQADALAGPGVRPRRQLGACFSCLALRVCLPLVYRPLLDTLRRRRSPAGAIPHTTLLLCSARPHSCSSIVELREARPLFFADEALKAARWNGRARTGRAGPARSPSRRSTGIATTPQLRNPPLRGGPRPPSPSVSLAPTSRRRAPGCGRPPAVCLGASGCSEHPSRWATIS